MKADQPPASLPPPAGLPPSDRLRGKSALFGLLPAVPIALFLYFVVSENRNWAAFAAKERAGVEHICALRRLLEPVERQRAAAVESALAGKPPAAPDIAAGRPEPQPRSAELRAEIESRIAEVDEVDARLGRLLDSTAGWTEIKDRLAGLAQALPFGPRGFADADASAAAAMLRLATHVGDTSNLITDPDLDAYYLMDTAVDKLPLLIDGLSRSRIRVLAALSRSGPDADARIDQAVAVGRARQALTAVGDNADKVFAESPHVRPELEPRLRPAAAAANAFLDAAESRIVKTAVPAAAGGDLNAAGGRAVAAAFDLYDAALASLDAALEARLDKLSRRLWLIAAVTAGTIAVFAFVLAGFRRSLAEAASASGSTVGSTASGAPGRRLRRILRRDLGSVVESFLAFPTRLPADATGSSVGALPGSVADPAITTTVQRFLEAVDQDGRRANDSGFGELEVLGRGGMGIVYRGHDAKGEPIALKTLEATLTADAAAVTRFCNEIRLVARFDHPHIVTMRQIGRFPDGRLFFTMELMQGDLSGRTVPMPAAAAARIAARIAAAVAYAHAQGDRPPRHQAQEHPLHQGRRPQARGLRTGQGDRPEERGDPAGRGHARLHGPRAGHGAERGQALGRVFAGALLCWLLTGRTDSELLGSAGIDSKLQHISRLCLDDVSDQRPEAAELAAALSGFLGETVAGPPLVGRPKPAWPPTRRTVLVSLAGATAAAALGVTASCTGKPGPLRFGIASEKPEPFVDAIRRLFKQTQLAAETEAVADYEEAHEKFRTRWRDYDIVMLDDPWLPEYSAFLTPLEGINASDGRLGPAEMAALFGANVAEVCRYDGSLFALPVVGNAQMMAYRADYVKVPRPREFGSLLGLLEKLRKDGATEPFGLRYQTGNDAVEVFWELLRCGGTLVADAADGDEIDISRPAADAAFDWMNAVRKLNGKDQAEYGEQEVDDGLFRATDPVRFAFAWPNWIAPRLVNEPAEMNDKLRLFNLSAQPVMGVWLLGITRACRRPADALELIRKLSTDSQLQYLLAGKGNIPTLSGPAFEGMERQLLNNPFWGRNFGLVTDCLRRSAPRPRSRRWWDIEAELGRQLKKGDRLTDAAGLFRFV